ncbi:MAG TPA: YfhO family protein, partial [Blastocatellia bacterium]|nr:YfhO family protein [Blastocatellia bacterium]
VLAAFGFDAFKKLTARKFDSTEFQTREALAGLILALNVIAIGIGWWRATGLKLAAGGELLKRGITTQVVTLPEASWWNWKLGFTASALIALVWCWRMQTSRWRNALLATTVAAACFVESFMLVSAWWYPNAKPASYYQAISAPMQFLKQYSPEQNRIYTSSSNYFALNQDMIETNNLTAPLGFHNAAGYEPLMSQRYSRAFDEIGASYMPYTPWLGAPTDRQLLSPNWQVLDLLNTRFVVEFSASRTLTYPKDGVIHSAELTGISLPKGESVVMTGASNVNFLSLVSALAFATDLAQGQPVAKVIFHTKDGRIVERDVQAGIHTAEWAHERDEVKAQIKHSLAPIFESHPGDERNSFPALSYAARIPLDQTLDVDWMEIKNLTDHVTLMISRIALYDSTTGNATSPAFRLPAQWRKVYDHEQTQIYENQRVMPRAWLTPRAEAVSEQDAFKSIRGQSERAFDPREVALIEAPSSELGGLTASKLSEGSYARIVSYEPNRLVIETKADQPAALVLSEVHDPGWVATVDGKPATVYAADYLLRGLVLSAGTHTIELKYTAPAARTGAVISILSLLIIAGLLIKAGRAA